MKQEIFPHMDRMLRVRSFIEGNLHIPISVQQLADVAAYSLHHFVRWFKLKTGLTPARYIWRRRVERAKQMVLGNTPLAHIAHECGFASQAHFTTMFKRSTGLTPAAMRNGARTAP